MKSRNYFFILLCFGLLIAVAYQNCGDQSGFRARPYGFTAGSTIEDPLQEPTTTTTFDPGGGGGAGADFLSQVRVGSSWSYTTQILEGGVTCNGNATHTVRAISGQAPNRTYQMREAFSCGTNYPPRDFTLTEAQLRMPPITNCAAAMGTIRTIPGPGGVMTETCYRAFRPNPNPPPDNIEIWRADVPAGYIRIIFEDNDGYRETLNLSGIAF